MELFFKIRQLFWFLKIITLIADEQRVFMRQAGINTQIRAPSCDAFSNLSKNSLLLSASIVNFYNLLKAFSLSPFNGAHTTSLASISSVFEWMPSAA